jgi:hypothetical protein
VQLEFTKDGSRVIERHHDYAPGIGIEIPTRSESDRHFGLVRGKADSPNLLSLVIC